MMKTYKAIEITRPGQLNLVEKEFREPGAGEVRLKVKAAGVCQQRKCPRHCRLDFSPKNRRWLTR
jgi:Zn-dependent alcohol dehydrogenase